MEVVPAPVKRQSKSMRAGLNFPVAKFINQLKDHGYATSCSVPAGIYLASALQTLTSELLEGATVECEKVRAFSRNTPEN